MTHASGCLGFGVARSGSGSWVSSLRDPKKEGFYNGFLGPTQKLLKSSLREAPEWDLWIQNVSCVLWKWLGFRVWGLGVRVGLIDVLFFLYNTATE